MAVDAVKVSPDLYRHSLDQTEIGSRSAGNGTLVCPVLFLDLVAYSKKTIAQQTLARGWLNAAIQKAMRDVGPTDRIILDVGDGAAINFFCDAQCALRVGLELSSSFGDLGLNTNVIEARIGINLGPVCLVQDVNGRTNIIGDGINAAQRVMSFARPGQILVSRTYRNSLVGTSARYASLFAYQGFRIDKHARKHEIYEVIAAAGGLQKAATRTELVTSSVSPAPPTVARKRWYIPLVDASRCFGTRRQRYAGFLTLALLGTAAAFHWADRREHLNSSATTTSEATRVAIAPPTLSSRLPRGAQVSAPVISSQLTPSAHLKFAGAGLRMKHTYSEGTVSRHRMASIQLAISPWGEVRVDDKIVGVTPPLSRLELAPGAHRIEIKNGKLRTYRQTLQLRPSQTIKLKHKFTEELDRSALLEQLPKT
jgi:hypothetical protein